MNMDGEEDLRYLYEGNVGYIFACIPNMYRGKGKTLPRNERIQFYDEIIHSENVQMWMNTIQMDSKLMKLFGMLYSLRSPVVIDFAYYWMMSLRRHFGGLWNNVRLFVQKK
jgi:hypothetical protein